MTAALTIEAEDLRQLIPAAAAAVVQVIVDNPGQCAVIAAGSIVATRAAFNIVRPANVLQALALIIVLEASLPALTRAALEHGWLRVRVRDPDGHLIPLEADR